MKGSTLEKSAIDMSQNVLTFESKVLRDLGDFQGYTLETDRYLSSFLEPMNNRFISRPAAEKDPTHKQLIPYVVLRHGDFIFSYVRGKKSSELRLVAMRSIGVGGHIEPSDQSLFSSNREMYLEAARREVNEEVKLDTMYREQIVALINDDSTVVGKVHLGIMHIWDLEEPKVTSAKGSSRRRGFCESTN